MGKPLETARNQYRLLSTVYDDAARIENELTTLKSQLIIGKQHRFSFQGKDYVVLPENETKFPREIWFIHHFHTSPKALRKSIQRNSRKYQDELALLEAKLESAEKHAPPAPRGGFLRRLFSRSPKSWPELEDFKVAAAYLSDSVHALQLQELIEEWNGAESLSLKMLFADERKTEPARSKVEALLRSALELDSGSPISLFDVEEAKKLARGINLETIKDSRASKPPTEKYIRQKFEKIREQRASALIDKMELAKLREVTTGKLRLSSDLKSFGFTSVGDIYRADVSALTRLPGIGDQTASRMKAAAQTLYNEENNSQDFRLGNSGSFDERCVVAALKRYAVQRDAAKRFESVWAELSPLFNFLKEIPSKEQALLVSPNVEDKKELEEVLSWVATAAQSKPSFEYPEAELAHTWEDYLSRPAHYQAIVAELLGIEEPEVGLEFLDKKTIDAIRKLQLDTSLMRDVYIRGYQLFAAKFLIVQRKMLLGDEMGLGKTLQAISAAAHISAAKKQRKEIARILVVVPASLLINWEREIQKFSFLETFIAHGRERQHTAARWNKRGGILITTYDSLKQLRLDTPAMVIVDEAHMIKNPRTQRTAAVVMQLHSAQYVMLMTGTPIENRLEEFSILISYLEPSLRQKLGEVVSAQKFKREIAPFYLRRNQRDVLDELPRKTERVEWVELNDLDKKLYREAIADGAWMAARRSALISGEHSSKMDRIRELVEEAKAENKNVIIFSYFRDVLSLLASTLGEDCVGVIDGGVSAKKRQTLVDELGSLGHVLLAQITAGGVGLNIQHSSVVILTEIQVKPSLEDQAIARAHRMGQINVVNVHRIVGRHTIDERLLEITAQKRQLFDEFARESDSAKVYDATDITEVKIAQDLIAQERQRLGIESNKKVSIVSGDVAIEQAQLAARNLIALEKEAASKKGSNPAKFEGASKRRRRSHS
ncbi:SNF2-related protein [Corynebacterium flavescens]|uniref:SNF2-related protein n=1 Tax=Corynebacterium flavescens TaxID=28028 RepID=UPI000EE6C5D5|nr:ATP-dependent helicase [Corynebacterium flavescens]